jgi:hypothetical protein
VLLVAREGWRLLPDYRFDPDHGLWRHRSGPVEPPLRLTQVGYDADGAMCFPRFDDRAPESALAGYLDEARVILGQAQPAPDAPALGLSADFEHLRWFELPPPCLVS